MIAMHVDNIARGMTATEVVDVRPTQGCHTSRNRGFCTTDPQRRRCVRFKYAYAASESSERQKGPSHSARARAMKLKHIWRPYLNDLAVKFSMAAR